IFLIISIRHFTISLYFTIYYFALVTFVLRSHVTTLTGHLIAESKRVSLQKLQVLLATYRREHGKALIDLIHFNQYFASGFLFWSIVPCISTNIYFVSIRYFLELDSSFRYTIDGAIFFEFCIFELLRFLPNTVN